MLRKKADANDRACAARIVEAGRACVDAGLVCVHVINAQSCQMHKRGVYMLTCFKAYLW